MGVIGDGSDHACSFHSSDVAGRHAQQFAEDEVVVLPETWAGPPDDARTRGHLPGDARQQKRARRRMVYKLQQAPLLVMRVVEDVLSRHHWRGGDAAALQQVRQLEEQGQITIASGDADDSFV